MSDVLDALRAATRTHHDDLDHRMPLAKDNVTLIEYGEHLMLLRAWLEAITNWQTAFHDGPQDATLLPSLDCLTLLNADLNHPSMPAVTAAGLNGVALPWLQHSSNTGVAYRWGVAYVMEGSQLGSAVLYRRLKNQLFPHPLNYLRGDAQGPGPRWQLVLRCLRTHVHTPDDITEACRGARDAFSAMIALLPPAVAHC